jgi:hypothetical protein
MVVVYVWYIIKFPTQVGRYGYMVGVYVWYIIKFHTQVYSCSILPHQPLQRVLMRLSYAGHLCVKFNTQPSIQHSYT